ncbi:unnamed protein product [Gongylonema pulchrum]|uniref:Secreted protein n=1 Tax=Gongylonema pulchrum TaxID=637853 RepID=A0A183E4W2_9BILA|nr:unnamed protein product [Gongylonema pulchrum]
MPNALWVFCDVTVPPSSLRCGSSWTSWIWREMCFKPWRSGVLFTVFVGSSIVGSTQGIDVHVVPVG